MNPQCFSVKQQEDQELITNLRKKARITGISFSHLVLTALKNTYHTDGSLKKDNE